MINMHQFDKLVTDFAARYAVEGLAVEDGVAVLSIDGTEVLLREDAEGGAVVGTAEICEMPPDAHGVFAALALQANFSAAGATALSLDAETGELAVSTSLPLLQADPDSLSDTVETLVNAAEEWRRFAVAFLDVDEEAAIKASDDAAAAPISGNPDFIRV